MRALIVCGENFVNAQDTIMLSDGLGGEYLYDQKPASQAYSSGSGEGVPWTVTVEFKDRAGDAISRTFNRLILLNHNLAQFYLEYWNGSAWVAIAESVFGAGTPNADDNLFIEMVASVASTKLRLTATNTIAAVAEKLLGELKACLEVTDVRHLVTIDRDDWDDGEAYRLGGGGLVTFNQVQKFEASVKMVQVSDTTWQLIKDLLRLRQWMTLVFYEDFDAAEIYEVKATSQPSVVFDRKTRLYEIGVKVKER
jgi:hypothetical protein